MVAIGVSTAKNTTPIIIGLTILKSCSENHRQTRLSGPRIGAANSAMTQNIAAAIDHHSAVCRPFQIANTAIAAHTAANSSPKDRSEELGGGPSLCKDSCQVPSGPVIACAH